MWTILAFLMTLSFHAACVSSASMPANPTPTTQDKVFTSSTTARATRQLAPTRSNSSKASIAHILNFHHGTLATHVPLNKNKAPIFGWHTTVYRRTDAGYEQICGGSLVKKDTAISAAHCFWDEEGLMPAQQFAVTVGQARRRWQDAERYRSNVSEIIVPPRFLGITTNFQDDIAVVRLASPVEYRFGVKPVCVNFDLPLERWHLSEGYHGLITGFGLTTENGVPSEVLNYQQLPYVDIRACIAASEPGFLKYLTSDKICAGDQKTGRALCRGDSGGGLVFFFGLLETAIMYLRGIASAAPRNNNACNAYAIGSFTHLRTHRTFLRDHIPGLEEECKTFYAKELGSQYELKPVKPAGDKSGNSEDSKINEGINQPGNTGTQPAGTNPGPPVVIAEAPAESNGYRLVPDQDHTPNVTPHDMQADVTSKLRKPDLPSDLHGLQGLTRPSAPISNGNSQEAGSGLLNEAKIRQNPNTNIYFFTGPVVAPSGAYSPADAVPSVGTSRPEQPTNIYIIIQN